MSFAEPTGGICYTLPTIHEPVSDFTAWDSGLRLQQISAPLIRFRINHF
jgi:hypothetical protein